MAGGGQSGSSTVTPQIPNELKPLITQSAGALQGVQAGLNEQGALGGLLTPSPQMIAPQTGVQNVLSQFRAGLAGPSFTALQGLLPGLGQSGISQTGQAALNSLTPMQQQAAQQIGGAFDSGQASFGNLSQSALGSLQAPTDRQAGRLGTLSDQAKTDLSGAVQAGLSEFQKTALPLIQNQAALAGLGHSGAVESAMGQALSSTLTPLIQQQIQGQLGLNQQNIGNQAALAQQWLGARAGLTGQGLQGQLGLLGQDLSGQQALAQQGFGARAGLLGQDLQSQAGLAPALLSASEQNAAGVRGIQEQQNQADFLDRQRRQSLIEQFSLGPLQIFGPSTIGQAGQSATRGGGLLWGPLTGGSK